jgi:hypothetical protein
MPGNDLDETLQAIGIHPPLAEKVMNPSRQSRCAADPVKLDIVRAILKNQFEAAIFDDRRDGWSE